MVFCEIRERVRIAARLLNNARRWRASSIKDGNSGFRFVDSSIISSRKSYSIDFSSKRSDLLILWQQGGKPTCTISFQGHYIMG
jgi:hypothetical protein